MEAAISAAKKAKAKGDYAIGAVIIKDNEVLAEGINRVRIDQDPTHHGEIVAIRKAAKILGRRHLTDCILYTTHEPCPMCLGAMLFARMEGLVFGAKIIDMKKYRVKTNANEWSWATIDVPARIIVKKSSNKMKVIEGFMREECIELFHNS